MNKCLINGCFNYVDESRVTHGLCASCYDYLALNITNESRAWYLDCEIKYHKRFFNEHLNKKTEIKKEIVYFIGDEVKDINGGRSVAGCRPETK